MWNFASISISLNLYLILRHHCQWRPCVNKANFVVIGYYLETMVTNEASYLKQHQTL